MESMNILQKTDIQELILEEINRRIDEYVDHDYVRGSGDVVKGLSIAKSIIRKHMTDGWIPVEERLPEDDRMVLVTCQTKKGIRSVNRAYCDGAFWHGSGSMSGVIAWRPLPEPYRPERCGGE